MEWDSKTTSLEFSELEREMETDIELVIASRSSSALGQQKSELNCSVDLKLGGFGEFGSSGKWKEQSAVSESAVVPSSVSAKRARSSTSANQNNSCLVDGCKSDLSMCKVYHRRHKVCEAHSKTPIVLVGGVEQRFCQQCSRFHLLEEFDEVKRSCRKRLDGHNKRRRKPQAGPVTYGSGSLFPIQRGSRFSSYDSCPQVFPTAIPNSNWPSAVKNGESTVYRNLPPSNVTNKHLHSVSYPAMCKERKQFPFLQDGNVLSVSTRTVGSPVCPSVNTISSSDSGGATSRMFSDGLAPLLNSECAHSLLSSPSQTSTILPHVVPAVGHIPFGQPLSRNVVNYGALGIYPCSQASNSIPSTVFSCSEMDDENAGVVLVPDASDADLSCQDVYHVEGDGSSSSPSLAAPFPWQ